MISDIIIGDHQIRVSKKGYVDYSSSIYISENKSTPVDVVLNIENKSKNSVDSNYQSSKSIIPQNNSQSTLQDKDLKVVSINCDRDASVYIDNQYLGHAPVKKNYQLGLIS